MASKPPQTPEQLELRLLRGIRSREDLLLLSRRGITPDVLVVPQHQEAMRRLLKQAESYGEDLRLDNPGDWETSTQLTYGEVPSGNLKLYADEVYQGFLRRRVRSAIAGQLEGLDQDPEATLRKLVLDLQRLGRQDEHAPVYADRDALERLAQVKLHHAQTEQGRPIGIRTGLTVLDNLLLGWLPGELVIIQGKPSVGKSFLSLYMACVAYEQGNKILLISPEMSAIEQEFRYDVLMSALRERQLSHTALLRGMVDLEEYAKWLTGLSSRADFVIADAVEKGGFTLLGILNLVEEIRPQMLVVDGLHLIKPSVEDQRGWETIKEVVDGLKNAAQYYRMVVLAVNQAQRSASATPNEVPELHQSAYGYSPVEDANRVISMANFRGDPLKRTFKVLKNRSGVNVLIRQHLLFDVDKGRIQQLEVTEPQELGQGGLEL